MIEISPKTKLLAAFLAAASAILAFAPRKVDVTVISKGEVSDGQGQIVERYIVTDQGNVATNDSSPFKIGAGQQATCELSRDWTLHTYLHDCAPH